MIHPHDRRPGANPNTVYLDPSISRSVALDGPAYERHDRDRARFLSLLAGGKWPDFKTAYEFAVGNGYTLAPSDVPEEHRAQFVAFVKATVNRHQPFGLASFSEWFS